MITLDQLKVMLVKIDMYYPESGDKEKELETLTLSVNPVRIKIDPVALSTDGMGEMYRRNV